MIASDDGMRMSLRVEEMRRRLIMMSGLLFSWSHGPMPVVYKADFENMDSADG